VKPWDDIPHADAQHQYLTKLVNANHPFDFYWGRDFQGRYLFRFIGNFPVEVVEDAPEMKGIEVASGEEGGRVHLTLILESTEDARMFYYLCTSLMDSILTVSSKEDVVAARIVLTQLARWQKLLKNRGSEYLSLQQQIGLFGELMVLQDIFLDNIPPREAVSAWSGPLSDEQDFGYGHSLVEVKTARSTNDRELKISSFSQLDTVSGDISLVFQTLCVFEDNPPKSLSLNGIVEKLYDRLSSESNDISEQLGMRLAMVGYEPHPEYDKYYFAPVSRKIFAVEDDFPRIGSADIRLGISKVSYSILLESCLPFEIEGDIALNRILKGTQNSSLDTIEIEPSTLVKLDESRTLEFKSTLRYCLRTKEPQKYIEDVIIKSVAAMTNTIGGKLVVGVNEDQGVLGLDKDYQTLKQKNRDGLELYFSTLIINAFDEAFMASHVSTSFETVEGKDIYIINIKRSGILRFVDHHTKSSKRKVLYGRFPNSSREIPPDQLEEYIRTRPA